MTPNTLDINHLKFTFNIEAINQSFHFVCLEQNQEQKHWFGADILEQALTTYQARAVIYAYGRRAFLLFEANQDIYPILQQLKQQLPDAQVSQVTASEGEVPNKVTIHSKWLAQILINSLGTQPALLSSGKLQNLEGQLLYKIDIGKSRLTALQVLIGWNNTLKLKAVNFEKQSKGWVDTRVPQYVKGNHGFLQRVTKSEIQTKQLETYIRKQHQFKGKTNKAQVPFITIDTLEHFEKSKIGVWAKLHQQIKRNLASYLRIDFEPIALKQQIQLKKAPSLKKRVGSLSTRNIHLVDEIKTEASQKALQEIQKLLTEVDGVTISTGKTTQLSALNLRLIHPKPYYQNQQITDPYQKANPNHAIQHLYLDTWQQAQKHQSAILSVCLKEAQLKLDLRQGLLTLFDWQEFIKKHQITQPVSFITPIIQEKEKRSTHKIQPEDIIGFNQVQIFTEARLCTMHYQEDDMGVLLSTKEQVPAQVQLEQLQKLWDPTPNWLGKLEGLLSIQGQALAFYTSRMYALPNYFKVQGHLKDIAGNLSGQWQNLDYWKEIIAEFLEMNTEIASNHSESFQHLLTSLEENNLAHLSHQDLNKLIAKTLKARTKPHRRFSDYLLNLGLPLRFSKSKTNLYTNLPSQLELQIYEYQGYTGYSLGVPISSVQKEISKANPIRWIKNLSNQPINIQTLTELLSVDFVNASQTGTVLPFLLKLGI